MAVFRINGDFKGEIDQHFAGSAEAAFREIFENPPDSVQRVFFARVMARLLFDQAEGDSLEWFNGKDFAAPAKVHARVSAVKVLSQAGGLQLLTNPLKPMTFFGRLSTELQKEPQRMNPIDLRQIAGPTRTHTEVRLRLPAGWRATLPKNESVSGPPGTYEVTYAQVGNELRLSRTLTGTRDVVPANRMPDIIAWLKAIGHDDTKLIVLQRP